MCVHNYAHLALVYFFFFNDTATTEIYTLSLHDALPISKNKRLLKLLQEPGVKSQVQRVELDVLADRKSPAREQKMRRSEEHTSELQSRLHLVCRLLLEKKKPPQSATAASPR